MLHPDNRHRNRYDFPLLIQASPGLARFVAKNEFGDLSIDFSDPGAVKALNSAILALFYAVKDWDIPDGYLCPPIPGRADYLHHAATLFSKGRRDLRVLDIGTGANLVFPLIGHQEFGWSFVATDIDARALRSAEMILDKNPRIAPAIELRLQASADRIFAGILHPQERFDLTICNPPFHSSPEEAEAGSRRKWRNLGKSSKKSTPPKLNFGGKGNELWCAGGERAFVLRMIEESVTVARQCDWFTTLVSKERLLPILDDALEKANARDRRILEMSQGQKRSRILAWRF